MKVVSHCNVCGQLDNSEVAREMTTERLVLVMRDSSQEQGVMDYQVDEGGMLCAA